MTLRNPIKVFFSDDPYDWFGDRVVRMPGAPIPLRWCVRVIVVVTVLAFLYHLLTGSL